MDKKLQEMFVVTPGSVWQNLGSQSSLIFRWQTIKAGKIPAIILVRDGSLIPHAPLAQRTDQIQWDKVELKAYKADAKKCSGLLFKPGDTKLQYIEQ